MNIGDKIFLLYTNRQTKETSCDGPATIIDFLNAPLNDEGVILIKKLDGSTSPFIFIIWLKIRSPNPRQLIFNV
jgi:hypothetical protein